MNAFYTNGDPIGSESFRVCAFNISAFMYNTDSPVGVPAGTDSLYDKFMDTFMKCHADIYMFSEWDLKWNEETGETSKSVFNFLLPYQSSTYREVNPMGLEVTGQMVYSKYKILEDHYYNFNEEPNEYFHDNVVYINGKFVHLISTHLSLTAKATSMSQMQQILDYITDNNITSYVIAGDMNLGLHTHDDLPQTPENRIAIALEEIQLLKSLGGKSVQGMGWGLKDKGYLFNTVHHNGFRPPDGIGFGPYDNIVVSKDIRIKSIELVITEASDHDALCADLEI